MDAVPVCDSAEFIALSHWGGIWTARWGWSVKTNKFIWSSWRLFPKVCFCTPSDILLLKRKKLLMSCGKELWDRSSDDTEVAPRTWKWNHTKGQRRFPPTSLKLYLSVQAPECTMQSFWPTKQRTYIAFSLAMAGETMLHLKRFFNFSDF